jgi:glutathione S-transferase
LTAADILMSFPLQMARERVASLSSGKGQRTMADEYPKVWAYLKRLEDEPGYKLAEAKIKELEKKA